MSEPLFPLLKKLRLSGMSQSLEIRLHEAAASGLTHREFLELMLQDELNVRGDRQIARRIKKAAFRDVRRLEDFDFSFNTSIGKSQVFELATGRFVREGRDVLWLGPPGTGKSHLCQGIAMALIRGGMVVYYRSIFDVVRDFLHDEAMDGHERVLERYLKPDLLIIDDMGMKQLPKRSGEYLFEVIMRRHGLRSTMMTSNRPLEEWGKLIGDVPSATAILDRFLADSEVIQLTGRSYRLNNSRKSPNSTKAQTGSTTDEESIKQDQNGSEPISD